MEYDKQKFSEYGYDKSKTWRYINEIMKRKKKSHCSIRKIQDKNGEEINDLEGITNCLNDHFATVAENLLQNFTNDEDDYGPNDPLDYITKKVEEDMKFTDTKCSEILEIILYQEEKS